MSSNISNSFNFRDKKTYLLDGFPNAVKDLEKNKSNFYLFLYAINFITVIHFACLFKRNNNKNLYLLSNSCEKIFLRITI